MDLNIDWIKEKITKARLNPKPSFILKNQDSMKSSDLYTLFDKNNTVVGIQNLYQIKLKLNFSAAQSESFFIKNNILILALTSKLVRDGSDIQDISQNLEFTIS